MVKQGMVSKKSIIGIGAAAFVAVYGYRVATHPTPDLCYQQFNKATGMDMATTVGNPWSVPVQTRAMEEAYESCMARAKRHRLNPL